MPLNPQEVQEIVGRGESLIFQGRIVNNLYDAVIPTAVDLAQDDISRKQFKLDVDAKIAELQKQSDALAAPSEVPVPEAVQTEPEKKTVQTGRKPAEQ